MILYKEIKCLFKIVISQSDSNMCLFDCLSNSKIKHACTWHAAVKPNPDFLIGSRLNILGIWFYILHYTYIYSFSPEQLFKTV